MTQLDLLLRGGLVVRPRDGVGAADVGIKDGRIAVLAAPGTEFDALEVVDVEGLHLFPGCVDPHAHIGLGGTLDEYESDTAAAALGGVTTLWYMMMTAGSYLPLLAEHAEIAERSVRTDYGFHPTLMTEAHLAELDQLKREWDIRSFKYFMHFRGDEGQYMGVEGTHDGMLFEITRAIARTGDLLMVHAENPEVVWVLRDRLTAAGRDDLAAWDDARPPVIEAEAIARASFFANDAGCEVYFVHVTAAESLAEVRSSRNRFPKLKLWAETCPHYLTHSTESDVGVLGKVNPPLRRPENLEALWQGIADGTLNTVGSDHVSRLRSTKEGSIWKVSAGFPCAPVTLPVLLSEGHHKRGIALERIADLTSRRPAELLRCSDRKGDIRIGADADIAAVDLDWERTPDASWLGTYADYSLYEDWPLRGWPRHTLLRGEFVVRDGAVAAAPGCGSYLRRLAVPAAAR